MKKLTANPFKFGDPVQGDYYLHRPNLASLVRQFLDNRIHVVLMGPRRFGKTSFVINLLSGLEEDGYTCILVDIFNITSHRDFLQQMLRAVRAKRDFKDKLKSFWKRMGQLEEEDVKAAIQDLLEDLSSLGKKVIVTLDEFQKISEIDDKGWLEATLRTHFQRLKNVSFLFTGSRKSLISEMLNNPSRPLYRSCQTIEFPAFGPEFNDWVIARFATVGIECDKKAIAYLRELVQDTPNYVQMVCFHLVAQARSRITSKVVEEVLNTVARQNAYAYQTLLNSLTLAQQRVLRLAANERRSLFQKEMFVRYEISSASALHSSINALKAKGILDEEGTSEGDVLFDDPLFAYWLRLCFRI